MLGINCPFKPPCGAPNILLFPPFSSTHAKIYYHRRHQHARIFFCRAHLPGVATIFPYQCNKGPGKSQRDNHLKIPIQTCMNVTCHINEISSSITSQGFCLNIRQKSQSSRTRSMAARVSYSVAISWTELMKFRQKLCMGEHTQVKYFLGRKRSRQGLGME
jgi:hypothetical protein